MCGLYRRIDRKLCGLLAFAQGPRGLVPGNREIPTGKVFAAALRQDSSCQDDHRGDVLGREPLVEIFA